MVKSTKVIGRQISVMGKDLSSLQTGVTMKASIAKTKWKAKGNIYGQEDSFMKVSF